MSSLQDLLNDAISVDDIRASIAHKLRQGGWKLDKPPTPGFLTATKEDFELFHLIGPEIFQLRFVQRFAAASRKEEGRGDEGQGSEQEREEDEDEDEDDETHQSEVKRRRVLIETLLKTPSNSTHATLAGAEEKCDGPAIKNGRCSAQQAPMVLFNDIVGTFRQRCKECKPSAVDARAINDLSKEVGQHYFRDEDNKYTPAVRKVMRPYLGRPHPDSGVSLVWTQILSGMDGTEWSDGGILGPGGSILCVSEHKISPEEKHEVQCIRYHDRYCNNILDGLPLFDTSYMPCLAVTFTGSIMRIGGLVRGEVEIYEIFETVDMLDLWRQQPGTMRRGAQILKTLYDTLHLLHAFYEQLLKSPPPRTLRISLLTREVPVALHDAARYSRVRMLQKDGNPCLFTYRDPQTDQKFVAKIVRGLINGDVHSTWALAGYAPKLAAEPEVVAVDLDGPLILLRMEFLSTAVWRYPPELLDAEKPAALDAAKRALDVVHGLELPSGGTGVHGDLRAPNVLLRGDDSGVWHVVFLDCDWSGELGNARYPDLPNRSLQWPPGADWDELITQEHDRWQLEHAFADLEDGQVSVAKRPRGKRRASGSPSDGASGVSSMSATRRKPSSKTLHQAA